MLRDLISNIKLVLALSASTKTADANGATIDTQGFGAAVMSVVVGVSGDTLSGSLKAELELEHSDDGSSWSDCANADLSSYVTGTNTGTFAVIDDAAEDDAVYKVAYKGSKRYIRLVYNITGTHSNGMPVAATAILGAPERAPAA